MGTSGGRKEKLTPKDVAWAKRAWRNALPVRELCRALELTKASLYRYADKYEFGPHPNRFHQYENRTVDPRPEPKIWRCHCGGRCYEGPVHAIHGEAA
jgi:hypothetical protein